MKDKIEQYYSLQKEITDSLKPKGLALLEILSKIDPEEYETFDHKLDKFSFGVNSIGFLFRATGCYADSLDDKYITLSLDWLNNHELAIKEVNEEVNNKKKEEELEKQKLEESIKRQERAKLAELKAKYESNGK